MATQHYQPSALPMNVPSKAPGPVSLYPISRVSGSPPEFSDTSTTTGSRTSGGFSYGSGSAAGDYESSAASFSSVDVVDVLNDRLQNAFDPTPLDKGLAMQAQVSGQLNAKQRELLELQALAQRRLKGVRASFADGIKVARETKRDLEWTQKRVKFPLRRKDERISAALRRDDNSWQFLVICISLEMVSTGKGSASPGRVRSELTNLGFSTLKAKAESLHPEEYRRASKKYTFDDN